MQLPWFVADDRTGPRMQLRPTQGHPGLEHTGERLRAHLPHPFFLFRGVRGRGLFVGMGVPVLKILLVQVLLDAPQDRDQEVMHRVRVSPSAGGALGLPVCPADGLGDLGHWRVSLSWSSLGTSGKAAAMWSSLLHNQHARTLFGRSFPRVTPAASIPVAATTITPALPPIAPPWMRRPSCGSPAPLTLVFLWEVASSAAAARTVSPSCRRWSLPKKGSQRRRRRWRPTTIVRPLHGRYCHRRRRGHDRPVCCRHHSDGAAADRGNDIISVV